jgi:hypothetical protein
MWSVVQDKLETRKDRRFVEWAYIKKAFESSCHGEPEEKVRVQKWERKKLPFVFHSAVVCTTTVGRCYNVILCTGNYLLLSFPAPLMLTILLRIKGLSATDLLTYFHPRETKNMNTSTSNWSVYSFVVEHFQHAHWERDRIARHTDNCTRKFLGSTNLVIS